MSVHWPIVKSLLRRALQDVAVDDRRSWRGIDLLVGALHVASAIEGKCSTKTVGVLLPTGATMPMAALAGWMLGKTVVPLNYLLKHEELQYVIDDCETDTIVTAGAMLDYMKFTPRVANLIRMDELDYAGMPSLRWPATAEDEDLAVLLYTSGTSGKPKGVMLTHGNLVSNMQQVQRSIHFTHEDVMIGVLPQFHSFGLTVLTLLPLAGGIKVVYTARFVPAKLVRLIREHKGTVFIAVASMYGAMLSLKEAHAEDFATLRYIISGGEPLSQAVAAEWKRRFNITLNEGYGLTETSPVTNVCMPWQYKAASVGPPLPDVIERIVDINTGATLGAGREGEVQIKGPNVMRGYFKLPAETAGAFTSDGYLRTGDIGKIDEDGHLSITGRLKEMMIIGGENVFPREIEEVLHAHPGVAMAGVIGVRDPMRGELPMAFVEMKEGAAFDERDLLAWCRRSLAGYKVPAEIRRLDALPKGATGKVQRRELKSLVEGEAQQPTL